MAHLCIIAYFATRLNAEAFPTERGPENTDTSPIYSGQRLVWALAQSFEPTSDLELTPIQSKCFNIKTSCLSPCLSQSHLVHTITEGWTGVKVRPAKGVHAYHHACYRVKYLWLYDTLALHSCNTVRLTMDINKYKIWNRSRIDAAEPEIPFFHFTWRLHYLQCNCTTNSSFGDLGFLC